MTPPQRRALEVLWEYEAVFSAGFAERMWPDSPATYLPSLTGAAATFLGRLRKMGLVRNDTLDTRLWLLTELGQRVLRRERILEKIA